MQFIYKLTIMMFFAIIVRIKINDTFIQTLPALTYLIVNAIICIDVVTKAKK